MNWTENIKEGVRYLSDPYGFESFQERYLAVREKENRLLTDEQVASLPYLSRTHPLWREWLARADSMDRFGKYMKINRIAGPVLDLGCGNGWFMHFIQTNSSLQVTGLDVNIPELEQASRVFRNDGLSYCFGDIFEDIFEPGAFGMITMNASAQYFPDIIELIYRLQYFLKDDGEIHFLDTPFYRDENSASEAAERTRRYYSNMGFPEMSSHYHHHQINTIFDIKGVETTILYKTSNLKPKILNLLRKSVSPFPWIRLRKDV